MKKSILLLSSTLHFCVASGLQQSSSPFKIAEDFVKPGFVPVENIGNGQILGLCESDCDTDEQCADGLLCANGYKAELKAVGLDPWKANCYSVQKPIYWEVCFRKEIINSGGGGGDPHFRMYDDTMYSFHGQCDLVMASSPSFDDGNGLDLHIRTDIVDGQWSLISHAALRVGNDVLEIVNDKSHYYNGVKDVEFPITMAGKYQVSVSTEDVTTKKDNGDEIVEQQLTYSVHLHHENAIKLQTFNNMITVNVATYLHDTHGMLGYRTTNGMIGRDGMTVLTDPNAFGQEWQVRDFERMLFHEVKGQQYPEPCYIPAAPVATDQRRRRLRQSKIPMDDAITACQFVNQKMVSFCIDDVIRTGDHSVAQMYMGDAW